MGTAMLPAERELKGDLLIEKKGELDNLSRNVLHFDSNCLSKSRILCGVILLSHPPPRQEHPLPGRT